MKRLSRLTLIAALAFLMSQNEGQGFIARLNMPSEWAEAVTGMVRLLSDAPKLGGSHVGRLRRCFVLWKAVRWLPSTLFLQLTPKRGREREVGPLFRKPEVCTAHSAGWRSTRVGCASGALGGRDSASHSGRSPGGRGDDSGGRAGVGLALLGGFGGLMRLGE